MSVRVRFEQGQVGEWRGFCHEIWRADSIPCSGARFAVEVELKRIGDCILSAVSTPFGGFAIGRSRLRAELSSSDLALTIVHQGGGTILTDDDERPLVPGQLCLVNGALPFEKRIADGDYREVFVLLPNCAELDTSGARRAGLMSVPCTGAGAVLVDLIASLARHAPAANSIGAAALVRSLLTLLSAVFMQTEDGASSRKRSEKREMRDLLVDGNSADELQDWVGRVVSVEPSTIEQHRIRVLTYIDAHLHEPGLGPQQIADAHHMSLRYLHRLFEGTPETLASTILVRRLDRCREALISAKCANKRMSELAFEWGFNDAAHFSRAFRARFGISPSELREKGREGMTKEEPRR